MGTAPGQPPRLAAEVPYLRTRVALRQTLVMVPFSLAFSLAVSRRAASPWQSTPPQGAPWARR